jgi:hypothetical protein
MGEVKYEINIPVKHDKVTPKKLRFTGEDKETGLITVSIYVAKTMPVHKMPDRLVLDLDLAEIGTK